MRGSGSAGSIPVAIPFGAPPVPFGVPEIAPGLTLGGGSGGIEVGIVDGGSSCAGVGIRLRVRFSCAPLPTAPDGAATGTERTYWMRSTGVLSRSELKSEESGYLNVIDAIATMTNTWTTSDRAIDVRSLLGGAIIDRRGAEVRAGVVGFTESFVVFTTFARLMRPPR